MYLQVAPSGDFMSKNLMRLPCNLCKADQQRMSAFHYAWKLLVT